MVGAEHEYALIGGWNRAQIGRWLALVAGLAASGTVFLLLVGVDLAGRLGLEPQLPTVIVWPIGAGAWYALIYWVFDRFAWKVPALSRLLHVPDLAGTWECTGRSHDPAMAAPFEWSGTVTIWQTWDKLRIRLKTATSGSHSVTAALLYDPTEGYRLMYHYRNDPRVDQPEIKPHRGFAEIVFDEGLGAAQGEYFNGQGRFTFGTLELKRISHTKREKKK